MELAVATIFASFAALLGRRLGITPIPIYILLGLAAKQLGLQYEELEHLAKLGVVFLLFYIGTHLRPQTLKSSAAKMFSVGIADVAFNLLPPLILLLLLGFDPVESLVLASAVYVSSSAINLKMLIDERMIVFAFAELVILLMLFEDLVIVVILSLLSFSVDFIFGIAAVAIVTLLLYRFSRRIGDWISKGDEVSYLVVFAIPASALLLAELKVSEALAAVAFGIAMSGQKLEKELAPFRDVFLAIFFVAFGTLIEFRLSYEVLLLIVLAVLGKASSALVSAYVHGVRAKDLFRFTLARGELSVALPALFAPEYASQVAFVVLITAIAAPLLGKIFK